MSEQPGVLMCHGGERSPKMEQRGPAQPRAGEL